MNLRRLDLNLLVVFEAVVAEASVSRAAHRLHLTQPALSHALARLRTAFGDPILVRKGRTMQATPRALATLPEVRALLSQVGRLFAQGGRFDPATAERQLHIGVSDYAATAVLAPCLARIQREAPAMRLRLHHAGRVDAPGMLRSGQLDLALGVFNTLTADLDTLPLRDEPYRCAVARVHRMPMPLSLDAYLQADHLNVLVQGEALGLIDEALAQRGLTRRIVLTVAHFGVALPLLAASPMVLTAPAGLLHAVAAAQMDTCDPPVALPPFRTQMAWARRSDEDEALRWLRSCLLDAAEPGAAAFASPTVLPTAGTSG